MTTELVDAYRRTLDPARPVGLTKVEEEIARLTVEGYISEAMALRGNHHAGWPLTLEQAAKAMGYKLKRARTYLDSLPEFNAYRATLLKGRRESEEARNLATLVKIRDDEGEGHAADRTIRLKAIQVMEGANSKAPSVTVNVSQQTNNLVAGYVIRLPAKSSEGAPMIEGNVSP